MGFHYYKRYWDRSGTTLIPRTANDNVDLGSGDFTTTGSATFADEIIVGNRNALADVDAPSNYHLYLRNPISDLNEGVGIAWNISSAVDIVGAAIIYKRLGSNALGELQFYTKQDTAYPGNAMEVMTLLSDGNVDFPNGANLTNIGTLGAGAATVTSLDAGSGIITTSGSIITTGGEPEQTGKFLTGNAGVTVFAFSGSSFDIRAGTGGASDQNVFEIDVNGNVILGKTANEDVSLTFDGFTSSGVLKWWEDEDYFEFQDNVNITGNLTTTGTGDFGSPFTIKKTGGASTMIAYRTDGKPCALVSSNVAGNFRYDATGEFKIQSQTAAQILIGGGTDFTNRLIIDISGNFDFQAGNLTTTGNIAIALDNSTFTLGTGGVGVDWDMWWDGSAIRMEKGGYRFFSDEGTNNLMIGYRTASQIAGGSLGSGNLFMGYGAGWRCTGNDNVYMGSLSGARSVSANTGAGNVGIGTGTLRDLSTGWFNFGCGYLSLNELTSAWSNVAMGAWSGRNVTTGRYNSILGSYAHFMNQTGYRNVVMGYYAGYGTSGQSHGNNTFIGSYAARYITTGSDNVMIGYQAGRGWLKDQDDLLAIDNTDTSAPLIYGDFANNLLRIHGDLDVLNRGALEAESLDETAFTNVVTKWSVTGDFTIDVGGHVDYVHSGGSGTLTQAEADMVITPIVNNRWYIFKYTTTNFTNTSFTSATITTSFAATAVNLPLENATHYVAVKSGAAASDFVISITSNGTCDVTFDNVSLKEITGGTIACGDADVLIMGQDASVNILGDTFWTGSGGLFFGTMCIADPGFTVTIGGTAPVEVEDATEDGWTVGELNEVTFPTAGTEHYLTVPKIGRYRVTWNLSGHTAIGGGTVLHGGVMVSNTAIRDAGEDHATVSNSTDVLGLAGVTIVDITSLAGTSAQISLWIADANSTDVAIEHGNIVVDQIGGT